MIFSKNLKILVFVISIPLFLSNCGLYKKPTREVLHDPKERVKRNIEEGRGFRIMGGKNENNFDFATSNPLWRASIDILDFMPLSTANYSGGLIISDWYSENQKNGEIKVTIKFLSTEIRPDGIDIIIHKRICDENNCKVNKLKSDINKELKIAILKKATFYKNQDMERYKKENPYLGQSPEE
tara:strand:- start:44 stop:592 length:549 start_codon:yes stop_codon:yes gene_type:complete